MHSSVIIIAMISDVFVYKFAAKINFDMKLQLRKNMFVELGGRLREIAHGHGPRSWEDAIMQAKSYNGWFTEENVRTAISGISKMLNSEKLDLWLSHYAISDKEPKKTVGVVMAGNIPLVGFHDLLCVLITGNRALVKCSSSDTVLPKLLADEIVSISPEMADRLIITEGKLEGMDAVVATGSNNSARYFEYYFGKYPNIIRKNRSSVAVLDGTESSDDLLALGKDIFRYFGLGCRNVSQLIIPKGYDLKKFIQALQPWEAIQHHHKYFNNYEYNKAILLVEKINHLDNGFLLLKEDVSVHCPVGVLHFVHYSDNDDLSNLLRDQSDQLQCVVSQMDLERTVVPFGKAQEPELGDYSDGVDTMQFLLQL